MRIFSMALTPQMFLLTEMLSTTAISKFIDEDITQTKCV